MPLESQPLSPIHSLSDHLPYANPLDQSQAEPVRKGAAAFLQNVTQFFATDFGSIIDNTTKGRWWTVTAQDVLDELEYYNRWTVWETKALGHGEPDVELQVNDVLEAATSQLQMLEQSGSHDETSLPLLCHLYSMIQEAAQTEAEFTQWLNQRKLQPPQKVVLLEEG